MSGNWHRTVILVCLLFLGVGFCAQRLVAQEATAKVSTNRAQQPSEHPGIIHALSEEVLLDLVARDKRGRAVRDLTPEQIEVFEDGVKQRITSFRFVEGAAPVVTGSQPGGRAVVQPELAPGELSLVSLVFERLNEEGRKHAADAARAFLKSELRPNVYVAVLTNDKELFVLQQFSNDRQKLERAVEMATQATSSQMAAQSASIVRELENANEHSYDANLAAGASTGGVGRGGGAAGVGPAMAEAKMAQMLVDMLSYSSMLTRTQEGRSSLYALLSLVKGQRSLPGRKTIIYFSSGLNVTPALTDLFRSTVSEANRSNVSVYSVDARGLVASEVSGAARDNMLGAESGVVPGARPSYGSTTSALDKVAGESAVEDAARGNVQDTLADLSRSTGGFLVANTNEMEVAMQRIAEDIRGYYALSYQPSGHKYDNKFHRVSVKVLRSGVSLQTRDGYLAAPPATGTPVFAFEAPMLAALQSAKAATEESVPYHAQAFHFEYTADGMQCHLVIEVPIADFDFQPDANKNTVHAHFSVMALVQGGGGKPLFKFSEDYPLDGPADKMDLFKKGTVIFARDFKLPTGRYTVETVAFDQQTQKSNIHRSVMVVPPPSQGVTLSSVSIIRRLDPIPASAQGNTNPLRFENSEIVPNLGEPISQGTSAGVPLYFVVYPSAQTTEKPQMELELSRGGTVIASAPVELPAPDPTGSIRYVGTLPVAKFQPGSYSLRALVRQGNAAAEEYAFFTVAP